MKAVSPTEPQIQQLTFDEKGTARELCHDVCLALIQHVVKKEVRESLVAPPSGVKQ